MNPWSIIGVMLLSTSSLAQQSPAVERFEGTARLEDGTVAYRETHWVEYQAGRPLRSLTRYFDPTGRKIAELDSDYRTSAFAPRYTFSVEGRITESAGPLADGVELQTEGERKVLTVDPTQTQLVLGQGLHQLVRSKLDELASGSELVVRFGIPSRLDTYQFRIAREESSNSQLVRLRIRIDNWLLALFAPSIEVDYDRATRRPVRYRGVSNLPGPGGAPMSVTISYVYSDDEHTTLKTETARLASIERAP